jgi:RNA-binding protein YlmH
MSLDEPRSSNWLRPSEQPFYRRAMDWVDFVRREMNWKLTDFLTPREFQILESVARHMNCIVRGYGGAEVSERQRAYIMPDDWQPQPHDFAVVLLKASTLDGSLSHGAVLGSILGTGIDRRKIGDIETGGSNAVVAVCEDIVPFLRTNWLQAGKHAISVAMTEEAVFHGPSYEREHVSLASLRLDALIGACCHWSRTKAKEAVTSGDVKLNFGEIDSPDESLTDGDIISVRHFGRIRVFGQVGESRKGRMRVEVGILKSKP